MHSDEFRGKLRFADYLIICSLLTPTVHSRSSYVIIDFYEFD